MEEILTLSESAQYLRLAPVTIYRLARRGELPAVKCGRSWRFHRGELEEWLRGLSSPPHMPLNLSPTSPSFRHLSTRETQAILRFVALLQARYPRALHQILLYGSRSRGDFRDGSDIDLLIVLREKGQKFQAIRKEITTFTHDVALEEDILLQTLILEEEEWQHPSFKSFLLVEKIRREGISLYG